MGDHKDYDAPLQPSQQDVRFQDYGALEREAFGSPASTLRDKREAEVLIDLINETMARLVRDAGNMEDRICQPLSPSKENPLGQRPSTLAGLQVSDHHNLLNSLERISKRADEIAEILERIDRVI